MPGSSLRLAAQQMRFIYANVIVLALAGAALLWLARDGRVDFAVAQLFFDPARDGFYLRDQVWLSAVGHDGLKWFALIVWLVVFAAALASLFHRRLKATRADLWWFCIAALCAALFVSWLKSQNAHACPWDIDVFGGTKPWYPLLANPPLDQPGRCWPGGHAAGGFSLLAGYFVWRDSNRSLARFWLTFSLSLGLLMSLTQIARGAHFLSHNLWTLWWCALVCLIFYSARRAFHR